MNRLKEKLSQFPRKTITYDELQKLASAKQSYEQFAAQILSLEEQHILKMIQSQGRNNLTPALAYRYRIHKNALHEVYHRELQLYRGQFHNAINLDAYFKLDAKTWKSDFPYIKKVNDYIERNGFPQNRVPAPERSFELVGDEKWIEQSGEALLRRINIWDALKIMPVADPLMFAINPAKIQSKKAYHLILENKTTYQALLPVLQASHLSTLIYGSGNKIVKSIENFNNQFPTQAEHTFFYFGDLDREGINIWQRLNNKRQAMLATPFYRACLQKEKTSGRKNQRKNAAAIEAFITNFSKNEAATIEKAMKDGFYYPQEVLKTNELQAILQKTDWPQL